MSTLSLQVPEKLAFLYQPMRYKIVFGGRAGTKCLGLGTPVMMYDGTIKSVEDIVEGELVMGPDSGSRRVLCTTKGNSPLYLIKQTSAMDYVVNEDHILSLKKSSSCALDRGERMKSGNWRRPRGKYPDWPDITNIDVKSALAQPKSWQEKFRGYRAGVVSFPGQPITIDPYFLGVWLGDGTSREMRITSADKEIVEYLQSFGEREGLQISVCVKPNTKAFDIGVNRPPKSRLNPLFEKFKAAGLVSNKHIPDCYIRNSEAIRLSLLAGLIDTDGGLHHNAYTICQVNTRLAHGIKLLADTLGFRTSIRQIKTTCHNNGKIGKAWRINISGDTWRIPCIIPNKIVRKEDVHKNKDFRLSQIEIIPIGEGDYAGFTVDGDHLFLLGDGTVTHNSWGLATAALVQGLQKPKKILCAREFQTSIRDSVHALLSQQIKMLNLQGFYTVKESSIVGQNGTEFIFAGLRHNIDNIKSAEGIDICWVEEAVNVSKTSWEKLGPTIRKPGSEIWVSFNPELDTDETYRRFVLSPPTNSIVQKLNWHDNPWFSEELRQEKDDCYARDMDDYLHIWEGNCKQTVEGAVYAKELQAATAQNRITKVPIVPGKPIDTFWDLGKRDHTSIWFAQISQGEYRLVDFFQARGADPEFYLKVLQGRGYLYGTHYLPHDAAHDRMGALTIERQFDAAYPGRVTVLPRIDRKVQGIAMMRSVFPLCWFDEEKCADGLQALRRYKYKVDEHTRGYSAEPLHDENSDAADAIRQLAQSLEFRKPKPVMKTIQVSKFGGFNGGANWMGT